jgi:hypothetical protein
VNWLLGQEYRKGVQGIAFEHYRAGRSSQVALEFLGSFTVFFVFLLLRLFFSRSEVVWALSRAWSFPFDGRDSLSDRIIGRDAWE